jgi:prepilin-type N-terminal cleavage/methylation domain-containing protein
MPISSAGVRTCVSICRLKSASARGDAVTRHQDRVRQGFTLFEILVVLILMAVAAGLIAPAFFPPRQSDSPPIATLVRGARNAAARRGETLYLTITASGRWHLEGGASSKAGMLSSGTLSDYQGPAATLVVSPIGTCAFDVRSGAAAQAVTLDLLTCELNSS